MLQASLNIRASELHSSCCPAYAHPCLLLLLLLLLSLCCMLLLTLLRVQLCLATAITSCRRHGP
jgi:hypothetical protein